ncbi:MAG TPA: redoxin family protein [Phycisphaerales bacterium]|nr:redoxin family protein [Phycisphaerales bacterium]
MRQGLWCVAVLVGGLAAGSAPAQVAPMPSGPVAPTKSLSAGDAAPALDIATWVKGDSVKAFEKGKAYVVEFWATWCGPCRASIPKLTATQAKYAGKGVTMIGVSLDQGADALDKVRTFVDKMGDRMGYTVALDAGGTGAAYMGGAGVNGIPHAFVIDKSGKMVWHGNPALPSDGMELVVSEVADGTFDVKKNEARQAKFATLDGEFAAARQAGRWEDAERALDEIEKIRPDISNILAGTHYDIIANGKKDLPAAMAFARKAVDAESHGDPEELLPLLDRVAGTPNLSPADCEFVSGLAQKVVDKTKGRNPAALSILGETLVLMGKYDEAIAATQKAVDVAQEEMEKRYYTGRLDAIRARASAAKAGAGPKGDSPKAP